MLLVEGQTRTFLVLKLDRLMASIASLRLPEPTRSRTLLPGNLSPIILSRIRARSAALEARLGAEHTPGWEASYRTELRDLEAEVAALLAGPDNPPRDRLAEAPRNRSLVLRKAIDHLRARSYGRVALAELCEAAGASSRTLRRAFREALGMGPRAFATCVRLTMLRRALLSSEPDPGTLTRLAMERGFHHIGQLGVDYRRVYGETLSATLRRRTLEQRGVYPVWLERARQGFS
jgi:AraC-like DNA-binding protein